MRLSMLIVPAIAVSMASTAASAAPLVRGPVVETPAASQANSPLVEKAHHAPYHYCGWTRDSWGRPYRACWWDKRLRRRYY